MMPCSRAARTSWTAPGRAGEAHSSRPKGSARTCTFIPCFLCFPSRRAGLRRCGRSAGACRRAGRTPSSRRSRAAWAERGCEGGQELDRLGDVAVGGGGPDAESGGELGIGVPDAQVGEDKQGLSASAQPAPPGADRHGGVRADGRTGSEEASWTRRAGRVDKHAKPLVARVILVENPSTRGFTRLSPQLPHTAAGWKRAPCHRAQASSSSRLAMRPLVVESDGEPFRQRAPGALHVSSQVCQSSSRSGRSGQA